MGGSNYSVSVVDIRIAWSYVEAWHISVVEQNLPQLPVFWRFAIALTFDLLEGFPLDSGKHISYGNSYSYLSLALHPLVRMNVSQLSHAPQ